MRNLIFFLRRTKSTQSSQLLWALLIALNMGLSLGRPLFAQQSPTNVEQPTAHIVSAGLNLRSGPGLGFTIIGYARYGDLLPIIGQAEQCRWLLVRIANATEGWISGKPAYTTINGDCGKIASGVVNDSTVITDRTVANQATVAAQPAVTPVPTVAPPQSAPLVAQVSTQSTVESAQPPAGQGCYLLQNRLGPPITVTFTNRANGKSIQVSVPHGAEVAHCMAAGEYTYTVSAAGFRDRNGELKIIAGDAYMLPIGSQ